MPIYFFSRGKHVATALTAWDMSGLLFLQWSPLGLSY